MIQLKPDCLIFRTADGIQMPCSAEWVTLELMGDTALAVEPDIVENASAAVLHYFKYELNQTSVSIAEFAEALGKVFHNLGVCLDSKSAPSQINVIESDLAQMALRAGDSWELLFFPSLRDEMKRQLSLAPQILRFRGLRECTKRLAGSPRWNHRCQILSDQIVDYLRTCWGVEAASQSCALVVL